MIVKTKGIKQMNRIILERQIELEKGIIIMAQDLRDLHHFNSCNFEDVENPHSFISRIYTKSGYGHAVKYQQIQFNKLCSEYALNQKEVGDRIMSYTLDDKETTRYNLDRLEHLNIEQMLKEGSY